MFQCHHTQRICLDQQENKLDSLSSNVLNPENELNVHEIREKKPEQFFHLLECIFVAFHRSTRERRFGHTIFRFRDVCECQKQ